VIWIDADEDGNGPPGAGDGSDAGEQVVPGVTVSLIDQATNTVIATTITDANGEYLFTGIPDGTYEVVVTDQNNVLAGLSPTADADDPAGPVPPATPDVSVVDLDSASADPNPVNNVDQDFGYVEPSGAGGDGVIGDTIFFDSNGSGSPDVGEGVEGVVAAVMMYCLLLPPPMRTVIICSRVWIRRTRARTRARTIKLWSIPRPYQTVERAGLTVLILTHLTLVIARALHR